jgi:zinc protease
LDAALELFAGALRAPALDAEQLEKEKRVVLGEFDLNESDPDYLSYRAAMGTLYGGDMTRVWALGTREAVLAATPEQLLEMHARYYVPKNALLILSGDVTPSEGRDLAERHFGAWPRAADPFAEPLPVAVATAEPRYQVLSAEVSSSTVELWWPGPSLADDANAARAGQLFSAMTFQAEHSLRWLVQPDFAFGVGLWVLPQHRTGQVRITLSIPPGNEAAALRELTYLLPDLGESFDFEPYQLDSAKDEAFGDYLSQVSDPSGLAYALGDAWGNGDAQRYFSQVGSAFSVRGSDVTRFARKYLRTPPRSVVLTADPSVIAAQGMDEAWLRAVLQ